MKRGLTFIEMMLALGITAIIGVAIASMLSASAYGTSSDRDLRDLVIRQKLVHGRLSAAVRSSRLVLAADNDYLVLWMADTDGSGAPNLSEIRRFERDADTNTLVSYRAPADLAPAADTAYALGDNFNALTNAIKGGATFPGEIWANEITGLTLTLDDANAQAARVVSYRFIAAQGTLTETSIGAASLRTE